MARLSILAICAVAIFAIGCGDSDDDSGNGTTSSGAAAGATEAGDDAMRESDGESMEDEGDAMKDDSSGDAMKEDGDAMKDDSSGDAMKEESESGDAMEKSDGDAMKKEAAGGETAMAANRRNPRGKGKALKAVGSEYGRVVADGRGEAFYLFDKEKGKRSRCYGACAEAWPPAITRGKPRGFGDVKQKLLGTTRRKNGKLQVTYKNHPLYYYVDDSPGTILCQNVAEFGGLWLVVKPNGNPVA